MGGPIGGVISSVAEGIDALGKSIKNAAEGDWGEAGEHVARVGLEAAGIAGTALGGPLGETLQEGIEGVLDSAGLEQGTGDVPAPGGGGGGFDMPGMLSGAADGVLGSLGGGALGKILGAVGGGGGSVAGGLEKMLDGMPGSGQIGEFGARLGNFGEAAELLDDLATDGDEVADQMLNAAT